MSIFPALDMVPWLCCVCGEAVSIHRDHLTGPTPPRIHCGPCAAKAPFRGHHYDNIIIDDHLGEEE